MTDESFNEQMERHFRRYLLNMCLSKCLQTPADDGSTEEQREGVFTQASLFAFAAQGTLVTGLLRSFQGRPEIAALEELMQNTTGARFFEEVRLYMYDPDRPLALADMVDEVMGGEDPWVFQVVNAVADIFAPRLKAHNGEAAFDAGTPAQRFAVYRACFAEEEELTSAEFRNKLAAHGIVFPGGHAFGAFLRTMVSQDYFAIRSKGGSASSGRGRASSNSPAARLRQKPERVRCEAISRNNKHEGFARRAFCKRCHIEAI